MHSFEAETAGWAWGKVKSLMRRHKVQRQHVTADDISDRAYDDLRTAKFEADEVSKWLDQLWLVLQRVNQLVEQPPPESGILRGTAMSWAQLFSERADFPPSPDRRSESPMDAGAAEIGARWKADGFLLYEEQLKRERARFDISGDAPKRRQVIEKLAGLYEATGKWQSALARLKELREINVDFLDDCFVADCDLRLGIAYYRLGRWEEAEGAIRAGLEVVDRRRAILGQSKTELRLRGYFGLVRLRRNFTREALRIFNEEVWPLVHLHDSTYVTATFHHRRALIHESLGDFARAHEDIGLGLALRLDCGAHFEVTRTLFYLGRICDREGYRRAAVAIWKLCEDRHLRLEDVIGLARTRLELGKVFTDWATIRIRNGEPIQCDVFEAELGEVEMSAITSLATTYRLEPGDGLSSAIPRSELSTLAKEALEGAIFCAEEANQPALRDSAAASLEKLGHPIHPSA